MKNNFITKIIGVTLAFAMMIGGAVGINAGKQAKEVNAAGSTTIEKTMTEIATANEWVTASGSGTQTCYTSFNLDENVSISTTGSANCGSYWGSDWRLYQAQSGTFVVTPLNNATISSLTITFTVSNNGCLATSSGTNKTAYFATGTAKAVSISSATTYYVANTGTKTSGQVRITKIKAVYTISSSSASVESVSVDGDMTTKTYNTVQPWNNNGLTPTVTMSDNSDYEDDIVWSYNPVSPAKMVKDAGDEVTGGTVRATASASGESGYKDVSGISVNYATVAQLADATPASGMLENIIVKGIISQVDEVSTQYGNATYFISDDGTTTNQYQIYRGKGLNEANFTNTNDLQVGDIVVIYGNAKTHNSTKELDTGSYLLSFERPASTEPAITIINTDFTFKVGDADVELEADAENIPEGGSVTWTSSDLAVATIVQENQTFSVHAVAAGTTTITAKILNAGAEMVASNAIQVQVLEQLLEDGDSFVIKANFSEHTYYLTGVSASNLGTVSDADASSDAMIFTAVEGQTAGQFQFKNGDEKFLSYSGSQNAVYLTDNEEADSTFWTALYDGSGTIVESVKVAGRRLRYNNNSGDSRFACYTSAQTAIDIEKVAAIAVNAVSASLANRTYYENTQLTASDFTVTVTWTGGKSDTHPTTGFTWTVNGVENGTLTSGSNTVVVTYSGESSESIVISAQAQNARMYLNNTDKIFSISGEEETTGTPEQTSDIDLSQQGFNNAQDVSGSHPIDSNVNVNFSSGCKYYDSGDAVRVYASNSFTISSDIVITNIAFTWDGSYKPGSNVASTGTYANSNNTWTGSATSITFSNGGSSQWRVKTISVTYGDGSVTVDHVELRFGASIPQTDWTNINSNWTISDYGVMFMKKTTLQNSYEGKTIAQAYVDDGLRPTANVHKGSGETPYEEDDNYVFTARINMTSEANYGIVYVAAPYIVAGDEIFFLEEIEYSVNTMAQYYLNHSGSTLSNAALTILAGNQGD